MIKYLGSKRRLVPLLSAMARSGGARTALDLFTGTARVARALKQAGLVVTAVDTATYSKVLADTYVATDAATVDLALLEAVIDGLSQVPGRPGYVTEVFCENARYFHPDNGMRIDAIRDAIEEDHAGSAFYPLLLTSLLEAADRVDSTTGLQMAYLKAWAPRALNPLVLRVPELVSGPGRAVLGDALEVASALGSFDVAYLDPPYNQHRYFGNYHVWETLVRWDAPEHYGIACKRTDCREDASASPFNRRREMPAALRSVVDDVDARLVLLSYNDEAWVSVDELVDTCRARGDVAILGIDQPRYVGARIGIHNPLGEKVGTVSHLRNTELVIAAGAPDAVRAALAAGVESAADAGLLARVLELDEAKGAAATVTV